MKTKKLLSLLLALMMMLSVVPMYASAADPIALTTSNIVTYPTAEYINNGAIYFGQKVGDAISFSGGEVQYNGETVPGHFEPVDINTVPTSTGTQRADIKFIPDDTTLYSGFEYKRCRYVTYTVSKTTPVFVDAENDPLVASEVEAGAKLSTSILSGGKMVNPYNADEAKIAARAWEWSNPDTIINESGYYEAMFVPVGYEKTTAQVYVKIAGEIPETEIAEMPTIADFVYNPNLTWKDVKIEGGKAVLKGTETEIEGSFIVADNVKDWVPTVGLNNVPVVFTPYDAEVALPYSFNIPVTVNPLPISFKGNDGNFIVDGFEFEVDPGTLMRDVQAYLMDYLNYPPQSVIGVEDRNSYAENGRTYKLTVQHENTNYVGTEVSFTVKFKEVEFTPTFKSGYLNSAIDCGDYSPAGTFTVSLDGKEIAVVKENEQFTYTVENSGDYVLSAKYNPVENDYFVIADATKTVNVKLQRTVNRINCTSNGGLTVTYGDTVELSANATTENFDRWVITDASGNEVDLGVDLTQLKITFTMPDFDLNIEAKTKSATSGGSGGLDIDGIFGDMGDLTEGDSEWAIINIIRNLIAKFKSFLQQLIETFQSIGG